MPLPETIAVKYTEEEAEYLSMRPLVRQTFRAAELVDMIVQVAGKDSARVQQILRAGTIVFHSFRYWWQGFDPDAVALAEILARYPDAEPARSFRAADCVEVVLESSGSPPRHSLRITKESATKASPLQKIARALRNKPSFWQVLMNFAEEARPRYREYSYTRRADLYSIALTPAQTARLAHEAAHHAPRTLRAELREPPAISQIVFICARPTAK
ncbi:MAG TPA: hypothetical protein VN902_20375 [Candidatus Acidoferrales bacterium]|nr:hypothetical protein [Candidatus Acidoferrales bacterium]